MLVEYFSNGSASGWHRHAVGAGNLSVGRDGLRLANGPTGGATYTNAQIDDYQGLPRRRLRWVPPLRLSVTARFSHPIALMSGTAGFGFWNDPLGMTASRPPAFPRAVWFFLASPPSDMRLAMGVPGAGLKAATIDAGRLPFLLMLPAAPAGLLLARSERLRRCLWPLAQKAMCVNETLLKIDITKTHVYTLEWLPDGACFYVNGHTVFACRRAPRGPLGLVIWLDNQYMILHPTGRMGHGYVAKRSEEFLLVQSILLESLAAGG